jgi:hypothetical protein
VVSWIRAAACALTCAAEVGVSVGEERPATERQALEDAWWTGPIVAAGANTLPPGHFLIEPYVFDSIRQDGTRNHSLGSLTYVLYGLIDDLSVGVIPRFGYNSPSSGASSSRVDVGDFMVQGQYRLTRFREGSWLPTLSVVLAETLPTGRYDRLGTRPSDGFGHGAYTTTLSLYSQTFLWMPNGRIVRTRLNLSYSLSSGVGVDGVSVYGTGGGFHGRARPGRSLLIDSAWEYSLTRRWVLATDLTYEHDASTSVVGVDSAGPRYLDSGSSHALNLAPAIEYNWSSRMGVIAGAIVTPASRNVAVSLTPVVAVNMVF